MKKFLLTIFLIAKYLLPQTAIGAEETAIANSGIASFGKAHSIFLNPASQSKNNSLQISNYYSPSPFGLSELSTISFTASDNFSFGVVSIGFSSFGYELFREKKFLLSGAKMIDENLSVGGNVRINQVSIANYGNDAALCVDAGMIYLVNEQFQLGASLQNVNRATYGDDEDQIGSSMIFGFQYRPLNSAAINFSIGKETRYTENLQIGVEYKLMEYLEIRTGAANNPSIISGGFGIEYLFSIFDYAVTFHRELGFSHHIALTLFPELF